MSKPDNRLKTWADYTPEEKEALDKRLAKEKVAYEAERKKEQNGTLIMIGIVAVIVFGGAWAFFTTEHSPRECLVEIGESNTKPVYYDTCKQRSTPY